MADAVFDRLELRLRQARSRAVVDSRGPRCSLRGGAGAVRGGGLSRGTSSLPFADADEDGELEAALSTLWRIGHAVGLALSSAPLALVWAEAARLQSSSPDLPTSTMLALDPALLAVASFLCLAIGLPLVTAGNDALGRLNDGTLHALRGTCPRCLSDVWHFVSSEGRGSATAGMAMTGGSGAVGRATARRTDGSLFLRDDASCHVCAAQLEYRTYVLPRDTRNDAGRAGAGRGGGERAPRWAFGRVYARPRIEDLG